MQKITKIVITGGPCAGKSTAILPIREAIGRLGYTVLFIAETATELICGGVAPWTLNSMNDYQECQFFLQRDKEKAFLTAAGRMNSERVLIVCDRGLIDNKAYMGDECFSDFLGKIGVDEDELMNSYDAVFHLVTAAKGAEDFYTVDNNSARTEDMATARELDDRTMRAWSSHPHFYVIDNCGSIEEKMEKLVQKIRDFLTENEATLND